jgi:DNA-directed RNA polymerase specialized sigma24 family protein
MQQRTAIERVLGELEQADYIRQWAYLHVGSRGESVENVAHEIRVVLYEKLLRNPALCDKPAGFFFVVVKNHFLDQARQRQTEARHCEFYDPASVEYEAAGVVNPPEVAESALIRAMRTADPELVAALLDAETHRSSGRINHARIAARLKAPRATYYRRLARLQAIAGGDRSGGSYQTSLWN